MSAEARKNCRTQGRYSDKYLEDRKSRKSHEKRLKESPTDKEAQEKKFLKRKSDGTKEGTSFSSENIESPLEYQENSDYSFSQLEERKKSIEIKEPGKRILSNTENGESSVLFEPNFYSEDEAWKLFYTLRKSTKWLDKNIMIQGVEYPQPRLVAWYGPLPYSYSGTTLEQAEMPDIVLAIKRRVEDYLKGQNIDVELNSVLLNLYRNNKDSVSWHSDDELTMGICPTIASISLGETRRFEMRPKLNRYHEDEKGDEYFMHLNNGSLVVMDGCMQEDWQHRVPKEYHDRSPRINLTFRTVYKFENGSPYSNSRVNNCTPVDQDIPKNPSKVGIDLDEKDFPPLGPVSSNRNSVIVYNLSEKAGSSQPRIAISTNKISEKESEMDHPIYESLSNIDDEINYSEEQWTIETPPSNKTTSRINDAINGSEEEWIVKTPTVSKALFKENAINGSEEEWIVKTPTVSKALFKENEASSSQIELATKSITGARTYPNELYEKPVTKPNGTVKKSENRANKNTFSDRTPPDFNISNTSEEEWSLSSPVKDDPNSRFLEITKSNYDDYKESVFNNPLTLPESDSKSHKDWYEESCNDQALSESDQNEINELREKYDKPINSQQTSWKSDKMNKFHPGHFENTYHRQSSYESNKVNQSHENRNVKYSSTRPNRFQSDNSYKHHEERAAKPFSQNRFQSDNSSKHYEERAAKPFSLRNTQVETNRCRFNEKRVIEPHYNKNISKQERNFKSDERKNLEHRNSERSAPSNDEKSIKAEFSNENIDDREQRFGKNQNSNSKERRNECSSFAVHSFRKHFSDIRNEHGSNRSNGWRPNVKAEEFIPGKTKLSAKVNTFSSCTGTATYDYFPLEELPKYDVDRMPSDDLKSYANTLKLKVLDRISEFEPSDIEELEVLCEITDGNQTDKNQKIICSRICTLVNRTLPNEERNSMPNPTMPRYNQQAHYRNENHYSNRR